MTPPDPHLLGDYLNQILDTKGTTLETRKAIFLSLAHYVAEEYAFIMLESGLREVELIRNFNAEFENGLRCAARCHTRLCKELHCEALENLRSVIRHPPRLGVPQKGSSS